MESMFVTTDRLPPARRIVTGHDADGQAVFDDDRKFEPFNPRRIELPGRVSLPPSPTAVRHPDKQPHSMGDDQDTLLPRRKEGGLINLWRTDGFPAAVQGPWTEYDERAIPLSDSVGTTLRIVDMPPGASSPMHRTQSIDFGVVLVGQVVLELEADEKVVKEGDVVVQRGTIHAWHNRTSTMARILFVLCPAEPVMVNDEPLEPCGSDFDDNRTYAESWPLGQDPW